MIVTRSAFQAGDLKQIHLTYVANFNFDKSVAAHIAVYNCMVSFPADNIMEVICKVGDDPQEFIDFIISSNRSTDLVYA